MAFDELAFQLEGRVRALPGHLKGVICLWTAALTPKDSPICRDLWLRVKLSDLDADVAASIVLHACDGDVDAVLGRAASFRGPARSRSCAGVCRSLIMSMQDSAAALGAAARVGLADVCGVLITKGARACANDSRALQLAAEGGHAEACRVLMTAGREEHRAWACAADSFALQLAAEGGHAEACRLLMTAGQEEHRARACAFDSLALQLAAKGGHSETCRVLLTAGREEHRARACDGNSAALRLAVQGGHAATRLVLTTEGADAQRARVWVEREEQDRHMRRARALDRGVLPEPYDHLEVCRLLMRL